MTNEAQPWQNRPSVIACWEHAAVGYDLTGAPVVGLPLSMDNVLLPQLWTCVPRACRLTRVCIHYVYSNDAGVAHDYTLNFTSSNECESNPTKASLLFPAGQPAFVPNCFCGDLNVLLDECDVWKSDILLNVDGTVFPLFRVVYHFELR